MPVSVTAWDAQAQLKGLMCWLRTMPQGDGLNRCTELKVCDPLDVFRCGPPMLRVRVSFTFCPGNNLPLYAELGRICSGVLKLRIQRHCFRVSAIGGSGHY